MCYNASIEGVCKKDGSGMSRFFMPKNRKGYREMATSLGGWNIDDVKGCNLPQKVQSAFTAVMSDIVGADYEPIAYLGSQAVNGTNYKILAIKTPVVPDGEKSFVKLIINEGKDKTARLVSISRAAL